MNISQDNYTFCIFAMKFNDNQTENDSSQKISLRMMIIADSGSTKTTWVLLHMETGERQTIHTSGINPFYQDSGEIYKMLQEEFSAPVSGIGELHFYGAGCANPVVNETVREALQKYFKAEIIEIASDLMAAARSLCRHEPGIACILGTGSNSCYYNGNTIEEQVSPLGFILGDEGSGAVLGKKLLADILKKQLPGHLIDRFFAEYPVNQADILDNIYRKPFPNRYAAGFTRFLAEHAGEPTIRGLVVTEFQAFFSRNVLQYTRVKELPVHFTGSIAWYFREMLEEAATGFGLQTGRIVQAPMEGLIGYHKDLQ